MTTFQKSPSTAENIQIIISSLKQFERKLDKLQDDVDFHGKTLKALRSLVTGLSIGNLANPDVKPEDNNYSKRILNSKNKVYKTNTTDIQYDELPSNNKDLKTQIKRKRAVQPLPSKIQEKWFVQNQTVSQRTFRRCNPRHVMNKASSPRAVPVKNSLKSLKSMRPSKAEAPRKATTLRTPKGTDIKRTSTS